MDEKFFEICIKEAKISYQHGDVPIGAVIVKNNKIIAKAHNTREKKTRHYWTCRNQCNKKGCYETRTMESF